MACASVMTRKRSHCEMTLTGGVTPLKRTRSSLKDLSAEEVISLVTQLSRSSSSAQQRGVKRKWDESTEASPSKRQRLSSTEVWTNERNDHPVAGTSSVAMDVSDVIVDEVTVPLKDPAVSAETTQPDGSDSTLADDEINVMVTDESDDPAVVKASANDNSASNIVEGAVACIKQRTEVNEARLVEELELICEIHPTVDPVYIREQLVANINDPDRISTVTFGIYEAVADDVPTREDREAREAALQEREQLDNMVLDMDEFVKRYPEPLTRFNVKDTDVTELYYDHAEVFLKNEYRQMNVAYIKKVLRQNGFHLSPAYHILKKEHEAHINRKGNRKGSKTKFRNSPRSEPYEYPEYPDEDFYWEKLFLCNQQEIIDHVNAVKEANQVRFTEAKLNGNLHNCSICLASDVFREDMGTCSSSEHLFCHECIRRSTEELLGQGRASFPCLDVTCSCQFSLRTLEIALSEQVMSLVVRRVQTEQLKEADIEHLASCPFCPYAVIIPEGNTSNIFHCENPECMEDSCRKCQQLAHIPYTCKQFKELREVTYAHYIENQMAEAMIRQCPKCDQRFIKEEGCNMMTCANCRINMCYICKIQIKNGYEHFRKTNCQSIINMAELHKNEVTKAFHDSTDEFRQQYPELRSINNNLILYNPLEILAI